MWFTTTDEGVFQYDGQSFKQYTVNDGFCGYDVWDIMQSSDGSLWFGTSNGLCHLVDGEFETTSLPQIEIETEWMKDVYPMVNPNGVSSVIEDSKGVFWIGTNGAGAYRFENGVFTLFLSDKGDKMPDSLYHNVIQSIVEDSDGNIWFSSFSHGGVTAYNGTDFIEYDESDGLGDDMITSSYVDRSGRIWFGTRSGGTSYFAGGKFETIHETSGPCQNNMATVFEDSQGRIWVASYARSGVCLLQSDTLVKLDIEGSDKLVDIRCIGEDTEGNIWFGGRYGALWKFDGHRLVDYTYIKIGQ